MSFLDSVLSSIETGKPARIPPVSSPLSPPVSSATAKAEVRKPSTTLKDGPPERKPVTVGLKRKAEEPLQRPQKPDSQVPRKAAPSKSVPSSTAPKPRPGNSTTPAPKPRTASTTPTSQKTAAPVQSKAPPKGSYADLMMKAQALQQKAPTQVGMFKHQAVPKEKLSKLERKKREMEAKAKGKDPRLSKKPGVGSSASAARPGDGKLAKKREHEELSYKGTARPTTSPAVPEYRGTAGLPPRRDPNSRKDRAGAGRRSRLDEYLGTDEEDEGDLVDDYDDHYSDASSDMEGGFNDVEEEEAAALAAARREDEEEWRAELAAKREKEERRKKLAALASRRY
ncbi:predicted protein [Aspergillus terreus NIH2624]|uniref:SPT2 chromatin protein n=1 Tax=Aspergillus terreus (strain NIH 2624 / FGSC A1156) TaxID=341663 RepID=Q0CPD9_ASPTN|nr:uncharacterized protein ATEG_04445 [Aspergillus terreus NIH2624]EAU34892.1 predicted protein [Aspergillus terreus NIH2624]